MIATAERLKQFLPTFKLEKKPALTLPSCLDALSHGTPYRCLQYEIRSHPDLTPRKKTTLINDLQKYYDPTWEWKNKNGDVVLREKTEVPPKFNFPNLWALMEAESST